MGALTSKPFAFTARSWELKSIKSINLFDGEGVSIKFNIRNNEILRILPTFDSYLNNEWINTI
jgi:NADH dehydrogenase/NADH:ubiquinone oxidoreductase subunit G